ncbi:protein BCL9 homolog [Drosophila teissieri]|uniref:protein BCL9 homolog n=1 Tax=Drosophila teissieri TaxID=7243 RepID=UPI001CBA2321|nr:protein BCL9 homolog [Drosophila teissieri]XP_043657354.1 protein BCL9 homolog [Drosophila teissieri]XP_043657355.1 protein BCL9 homolog [Drosophila teissieri]
MLSTTMPRSPPQAQPQQNSDASTSASGSNPGVMIGNGISATNISSPKNLKNEPFSTMSPDQIKVTPDEGTEKSGLSTSDKATPGGVAVGGGGNISSEGSTILRQNSSSSINSCLVASPQNSSEHSNSSNVSATVGLTQMVDCDEQSKKNKCSAKGEEAEICSNKAKGLAAGGGCGTGSTSSLTVKEEPTDVLGSLVNMKKEERENHSPTMSPVGFGSIGNAQDNSATPIKIERISSDSTTEKKPASLIMNNDEMGLVGCNQLNPDFISQSLNNPPISTILVSGVGQAPGIGVGTGAGNLLTANANGISPGSSNCLDYMQQQNHIFVFSTQLANKGAESVLSGQFQTIIAYHCTQPATKSFLEDFFMKNPLKMNKLQRHNALGMPWIGMGQVGPTPPNSVAKITQQQPHSKTVGLLKPQFNQSENSKRSTASTPSNSFVDQSEPIGNETELMCWDGGAANTSRSGQNSRNHVDSINTPSESQAIKILEAAGVDLGPVTKGSDPCLTPENNIVSLQGVKVPDENLTPQQRQHREEQLAKIKKMNQFLFPENENSVGANVSSQIPKIPGDLMMGMPSGGSIINATIRQLHMTGNAKSDLLSGTSSGLSEDVMLPGDVISDMGPVMGCNNSQKNSVQCGSGVGVVAVTGTTVAGINVNMHCSSSGAPNGNIMGSSTDILASFGNTSCNVIGTAPDMSKEVLNQDSLTHSHQGGVAQMEWSKIQQQFFEERLKGGKPRQVAGTVVPQQQTPSATSGNSSGSQVRTLQGPPPPYPSTQRSASVPIATQSPNPSSPNNLSLPSPRTTGAVMGLPINSPSMDGTGSLSGSAPQANSSAAQAGTTTVLSANKNCFQADTPSPSNQNRSRNTGSSSVLTHNLNSNPSTPLSHLSPKELDSFGQSSAGDNIKSRRPSPQGHRSPINSLTEANKDVRFAASSPGVIFNPHPHMQSNSNSALNAYKIGSTNIQMERQTSAQGGSVQFSRRSDNIPLNPNSGNRPPPNKMTQNFDPISSLAQMSQQLTSCVSSMGSPAGTGGMTMMGGPGPSDINIEHGMISGLDGSGIDAINQNNCHSMNVVMNSMGPRMLNPKMCVPGGPNGPPGFNPNSPNGLLRENSIGSASIPACGSANSQNFQGIVPPGVRMIGRMPVNFGSNFNPNIQVKASTPNTIQYMPVRAQNANNNNNNGANNVRMPPSLEFLQRYANPQMPAVGNGSPICPPSGIDGGSGMPGMMVGPGTGAMLMNSSGEQHQNKIANNTGASNGINFFQNCNQMGIMDEESGLVAHDGSMNIAQPSMIRGMRPHTMRPHAMGPRMQAVNRQNQYAQSSDGLDCVGDPSAFFNNATCNSTGPLMFASSQQSNQPKSQHLKNLPSGMCQNQSGLAVPQGQIQLQGQGQAQGQSLIGPTNNNLMPTGGSVGASNGVSGINFVGPSSTDLKYAQQYHSFQQQLYATNTRSQQQHQMHQTNMITMPPNLSPNPAFFVNK